jgi:MFS family permease
MPLRLFRHRNRAFAYLNVLILGAALMSQFFFLTQLLQNALGYSALQAGVAFLPMALTQLVAARSTPRIIARYGMKVPMLSGVLLVVAGMAWLTRITDEVGYLTGVLAPMLLFGIGVGLCFMPLNTTIMTSVEERDAGSASGLLQALLQIGGSVGIAVLTTVYSTAVRQEAARLLPGDAAQQAHHLLVHGVSSAYVGGLVLAVVVFLVFLFGITTTSRPATGGS